MIRKRLGAIACMLVLAVAGCHSQDTTTNSAQNASTSSTTTTVTSAIPVGIWNGNDAQLQVQDDGSALSTFDCGSGGTSAPIVPDPNNNGQFSVPGTYQSFIDPNNPIQQPIFNVSYDGNLNSDGSITFQVDFNPNDTPPNGSPGQVQVAPGGTSGLVDCPAF
jgi:hypothetical protein